MSSNFTIIRDDEVRLAAGGDIDEDIPFDAPDIRTDLPSVLLYRVDPSDDRVILRLEINGVNVHDAAFREETRTFHEVVEGRVVRPSGNVLRLRFRTNRGSIIVSDLVLLYQEQ